MNAMRLKVLLIMLVAVIVLAVGETLLAKGMKQVGHESGRWNSQVIATMKNVWVWAGAALLIVHVMLYMTVLSQADLSFALPLTAGSYPLAALLSNVVLHENVGTARWLGTALITLGVAIVSAGEATGQG
jgi:uncharacterized membrane protein